jgi:hypothetical protein
MPANGIWNLTQHLKHSFIYWSTTPRKRNITAPQAAVTALLVAGLSTAQPVLKMWIIQEANKVALSLNAGWGYIRFVGMGSFAGVQQLIRAWCNFGVFRRQVNTADYIGRRWVASPAAFLDTRLEQFRFIKVSKLSLSKPSKICAAELDDNLWAEHIHC